MWGLEAENEEESVHDEREGDGSSGVHEEVQFRMLEPVLLQPLQHLVLHHEVSWSGRGRRRGQYKGLMVMINSAV